ncbi:MAG: fumarylacetoacetate hydrolase family protein [Taibaiella sp.]|nr:fumarylacetoacetate hydrolase family protein [Taibaiella sp.]
MKIICIGRNYAAHAKELRNDLPTEPVIFMKPKSALLLPGKPAYYPEFTKDLQYECELVIKISKNGKFIQEKFAHKYYSEITLGIDFTARDVQREQQKKGLPWEIAKAFDGSAAAGTFVTLDESMDINNLGFELKLNGATVQKGDTRDMIFNVNNIISYVSKFFTLNTGDLIYTGTPEGVGPVAINDTLEGYLQGNKIMEVKIQ